MFDPIVTINLEAITTERDELRLCAERLKDQTSIKLFASEAGMRAELDVDFLESLALFLDATLEHLARFRIPDTLPPPPAPTEPDMRPCACMPGAHRLFGPCPIHDL